jgi:hypothetical protein
MKQSAFSKKVALLTARTRTIFCSDLNDSRINEVPDVKRMRSVSSLQIN